MRGARCAVRNGENENSKTRRRQIGYADPEEGEEALYGLELEAEGE